MKNKNLKSEYLINQFIEWYESKDSSSDSYKGLLIRELLAFIDELFGLPNKFVPNLLGSPLFSIWK